MLQAQPDRPGFPRWNVDLVNGSGLCSHARRVNGILVAIDDVIVDRVFYELRRARDAPEALLVTFVLGKEKLIGVFAVEPVIAKKIVTRFDDPDL